MEQRVSSRKERDTRCEVNPRTIIKEEKKVVAEVELWAEE